MLGIIIGATMPTEESDSWDTWKRTYDRLNWIGTGNTSTFPRDDEGGNAGNEPKGGEGK
jgi:hypothetical protein